MKRAQISTTDETFREDTRNSSKMSSFVIPTCPSSDVTLATGGSIAFQFLHRFNPSVKKQNLFFHEKPGQQTRVVL